MQKSTVKLLATLTLGGIGSAATVATALFLIMFVIPLPSQESIPTPKLKVEPLTAAHSNLATVLAASVHPTGVDYAAVQEHKATLDAYRVQLAQATEPTNRDEKLAFYINAYNGLTLALMIEKLPEDQNKWSSYSIRDAGTTLISTWKYFDFEVAGKKRTLDEIEHALLRPLGEPRIHFAINCASRSCPPLIAEPFLATTLETQLEQVTTAFAQDPMQIRFDGKKLQVNPIMNWFAADFKDAGGIGPFLSPYTKPKVTTFINNGGSIGFFDYDWSLNSPLPKQK